MNCTVSVLVPSYLRPEQLAECLSALANQARLPDQVVVVLRDTDFESAKTVQHFPNLTVVTVSQPGVIHAMNEGLSFATGEIIALTDDDAQPDPNWIEKLLTHFDDEIIGVGGRDILPWDSPPQTQVGLLTWSGKMIGNHHCGIGPPRSVDLLKGVNCAFRRSVVSKIGFDGRLLGRGAQVHWEAALCLSIRRSGATLIYDPGLTVHHFPAVRPSGDDRNAFDEHTFIDSTHNAYLVVWEHLTGIRRLAFRLRSLLIGYRQSPGLLILPFSIAKFGREEAMVRFRATREAEQLARNTASACNKASTKR